MDALSDLLRVVRLDGAFFFAVEAADPWSVETVAARELSPRILPNAEHLISYHIITEGSCYGNLIGGEPVELVPGDVLVFPHGDAHLMSSRRGARVNPNVHTTQLVRFPNAARVGPTGPATTSIICGFLGCDRGPFNPLLASLPHIMHLRGMSKGWIGGFTQQLLEESREQRSGSESVLTRLAEVMFIEVLRRYVEELPPGQTGWLAGLQDELVGRVLMLLHSRPAHHWTLPDLAREASSSRSALAERFNSARPGRVARRQARGRLSKKPGRAVISSRRTFCDHQSGGPLRLRKKRTEPQSKGAKSNGKAQQRTRRASRKGRKRTRHARQRSHR